MKKNFFMAMAAILLICSMSTVITGCADKEDGESNSEWVLRNEINGVGWSAKTIKLSDGTWSEELPFYFDIKFSASNKNFKCSKVCYDSEGNVDKSNSEKYEYKDGTAYTIKGNIVEGTVAGNPFFKMEVLEKPTSSLHCKITFYKDNKTYEISMIRALL